MTGTQKNFGRRSVLLGALAALMLVLASAGSEVSTVAAASLPIGAAPLRGSSLLRFDRMQFGAKHKTYETAACGGKNHTPGLKCSTVSVPLDYTGAVPGTVQIHVETLPAQGTPRGVLFLIAGGPGQGSAQTFTLGDRDSAAFYRFVFPGYILVAYDDRGTGDSNLINCPYLQTFVPIDAYADLTAKCAASLGAKAPFFSTADHASDLDAVRASLGVNQVALWGTSYGTKLAMAYALAYPTHVSRMLLDSVLPPEGPDSYESPTLKAIPSKLATFCESGYCKSATPSVASDVVAVANALGKKPVMGKVLQPNGSWAVRRLTGVDLLNSVIDADLNPGLATELPAALHAARQGNMAPLLRVFWFDASSSVETAKDLSVGLYAATSCRDGVFPWSPTTPIAQRPALVAAALKSLPKGTLGPFGSYAAALGNESVCSKWPVPAGGAPLGTGPLPDVPVLALSGAIDMRTPTIGATDVVHRFPHGQLLIMPGVGHSVLTADPSGCVQLAVRSWISGGVVSACHKAPPYVPVVPAYPAPLAPKQVASAKVTFADTAQAAWDAEASWLTNFQTGTAAGLYSAGITSKGSDTTIVTFTHWSTVKGIELNGKLTLTLGGLPLPFTGTLTVSGPNATAGTITVSPKAITGSFAGQRFIKSS